MGINPEFGIKTKENIEPNEILYCIMTMVQIFTKYGNYENRAKARTRYIPRTIGEEKYLSEFNLIFDEIKNTKNLTLDIKNPIISHKNNTKNTKILRNIIEQKQEGLYAVKYHPMLGNPSVEALEKLYSAISKIQNAKIRLSTKEEMFIINLNKDEAQEILNLIDFDNSKTQLQDSISCVGATICQQGLTNSSGLLEKLIKTDKEENFKDGTLPKICISGCQSSCAAYQTAKIGFKGGKKKINDVMCNVFDVFFNGNETEGSERFGEVIGTISADNIPLMFKKLGHEIEENNLTFDKWIVSNESRFIEIIKEFSICNV